jgi:hypothetical protein
LQFLFTYTRHAHEEGDAKDEPLRLKNTEDDDDSAGESPSSHGATPERKKGRGTTKYVFKKKWIAKEQGTSDYCKVCRWSIEEGYALGGLP